MPNKFQNKYRIPSARLKNWDYGSNGAYFITICTKNRKHYFGEVINGAVELSAIGVLAQEFWSQIPEHFPFVALGNFVVMPNHVHGILIIVETLQCNVCTDADADADTDTNTNTDTDADTNTDTNTNTDINRNEKMALISPKPGSISTIIRSFKSVVTKNARFINGEFEWQPRFHDHIIKNSVSFERIQNYIADNPEKWGGDRFYKNNL